LERLLVLFIHHLHNSYRCYEAYLMSVLFVQNEVCDARGKEFIELSEASSRQMGRKQF